MKYTIQLKKHNLECDKLIVLTYNRNKPSKSEYTVNLFPYVHKRQVNNGIVKSLCY